MQTLFCQCTVQDRLGLATPISRPAGLSRDSNILPGLTCAHSGECGSVLVMYCNVSCAGLSMQTPCCQCTVQERLGLASPISRPAGLSRDSNILPGLTCVHSGDCGSVLVMYCNVSCAGVSMQTPRCQCTVQDRLGLATPISRPGGLSRDSTDPSSL